MKQVIVFKKPQNSTIKKKEQVISSECSKQDDL